MRLSTFLLQLSAAAGAVVIVSACGGSHDEPADPPGAEKPRCEALDENYTTNAFDFKIGEVLSFPQSTPAQDLTLANKKNYQTPTRKLKPDEWPTFNDDLNFQNMILAIDRQLKRYSQIDLNARTIEFGGKKFAATVARDSLRTFKTLVNEYLNCAKRKEKLACSADFNFKLQQKFDVYVPDLKPGDPRYGEDRPVLFTAYYTPTLSASTAPSPDRPHPIYKRPPEYLAKASRRDIDFKGALAGRGLELFYTKSLFDLYLLHVQGGGRVLVTDESGRQKQHYLTYDGTNGQAWTFISKYMMDKGYISNGSIEAQRNFLERNPHKQEEIYATCPSYVYFKVTNEPPQGSDMVPLTDNRSIATDTAHYLFKGILAYVEAKRPANPYDPVEACEVGAYKDFSRFYLDQDTGGAIKGKGRVDLYFGEDRYAEVAAYNTVERGNLYFLLLKSN